MSKSRSSGDYGDLFEKGDRRDGTRRRKRQDENRSLTASERSTTDRLITSTRALATTVLDEAVAEPDTA